ncbi:Inositol-pentakisphosphate 2-kinase [Friedmanniomyces endolithicus]|nr:Inositol-pentakisphosphate 2-kinase [Friedmanniomyces endolithicus]
MAFVKIDGWDCRLKYFNEGGANFIFRILPGEGEEELPTHLRKKLLRMRKRIAVKPEDLLSGQQEWQSIFQPEKLIEHELVTLQPDAVTIVNDLLREATRRSSHRVSDLWPGGTHGVLVTDMSPGQNELLIELKPKWLAQSPNAPRSARRCRTCALRARRAAEGAIITATDAQGFCPLDLVSEHPDNRWLAAARLTDDPRAREFLVGHEAQSLFRTLKEHQRRWDPTGILAPAWESDSRSLSKAMTIRDCTLFVLVKSDGDIEARLGDLDMKCLDKVAKWRATEQGLVDGGWYMGGGDSICALSRAK